jgi:hypothetical protein
VFLPVERHFPFSAQFCNESCLHRPPGLPLTGKKSKQELVTAPPILIADTGLALRGDARQALSSRSFIKKRAGKQEQARVDETNGEFLAKQKRPRPNDEITY